MNSSAFPSFSVCIGLSSAWKSMKSVRVQVHVGSERLGREVHIQQGSLLQIKSSDLGGILLLWSLFDVDDMMGPELFSTSTAVFTCAKGVPKSKIWRKDRDSLLTAFPLWSRDEFVAGYVLPMP